VVSKTLAVLILVSAASGQTPRIIWEGVSGGYDIRWTTADLTAHKPGSQTVIFSLKSLAQRGFDNYRKAMDGDDVGRCIYQRDFVVVSVVGPLIGFRDTVYASCRQEAHPAIACRLTTIDLSHDGGTEYPLDDPMMVDAANPGRLAVLSNLFPPDRIAAALKSDPVVKPQADADAKSLPDLLNGLYDAELEIPRSPCSQTMRKDILTRFAIHHMEQGGVAVRMSLDPVGGACRSTAADLGLLLPVPDRLRDALVKAAARKEGFLQSGRGIAGETKIEFTLDTKKK
jgi:hypothetical protein